ncbi:MAG: baseplate J/gp47 family protein [Polyangiaceae bacterium]
MTFDPLPNEIVTFDRDEIVRRYLRDYSLRNPGADTGPKSLVYADALTFADQQLVALNNGKVAGRASMVRGMRGERLLEEGRSEGLEPDPAIGGSGYVSVIAATGGGTIYQDDVLIDSVTKLRFKCAVTDLYTSSKPVPVLGIDAGDTTNLAPGSILTWVNPRPGIGPKATVLLQNDGTGLSGGRPAETEAEFQQRIIDQRSNPPAGGNDAFYLQAARRTTNVAVEQPFTYAAIGGAGTIGLSFTLRPSRPGASRRPNPVQRGLVHANLVAKNPFDDGVIDLQILGTNVSPRVEVTWKTGAAGWVDGQVWPPHVAASPVAVIDTAPISATSFRVTTATVTVAPQVGQTIALLNRLTGKFARKRIAAVTTVLASHTWLLTFDTTLNASDLSLVPLTGALVSPWSESLDAVALAVFKHIDTLGPGEQVDPLPDPGQRQRRQPESPTRWPSVLTNGLALDIKAGAVSVADAELVFPAVPFATTAGTLGVSVNLLELADLGIYAQ